MESTLTRRVVYSDSDLIKLVTDDVTRWYELNGTAAVVVRLCGNGDIDGNVDDISAEVDIVYKEEKK